MTAYFTNALLRCLLIGIALLEFDGALQASPPSTHSLHRWSSPADDSVFQVGEELTYNVSYGGVDIGQVRIKIIERTSDTAGSFYVAQAIIDSYKGVPFVNLHTVYQSRLGDPCHSLWFFSRVKNDDQWDTDTYNFDYARHRVYIEQGVWKKDISSHRDTLKLDSLYQDGLSLFFLAREAIMTQQHLKIPTLVNRKKGNTHIDFTVEHGQEEIDAVNYPIDVVHFEGEAKFVGVFGLTGGFEGWFSNDAARVPILAKMKVLIGNVRIELMKWTRNGWTPPRAEKKQ